MKTTFKQTAVALAVLSSIGAAQAQEVYVYNDNNFLGANSAHAYPGAFSPDNANANQVVVLRIANTYTTGSGYADNVYHAISGQLINAGLTGTFTFTSLTGAQYTVTFQGDTEPAVRAVADANPAFKAALEAGLVDLSQLYINSVPGYVFVGRYNGDEVQGDGWRREPKRNADGSIKVGANNQVTEFEIVPEEGFRIVHNADGTFSAFKLSVTKSVAYRGRTASITASSDAEFEAKKAEFERSVDKQIKRLTKEAVVGAVVINVIADEFINPALKEDGVSVGATVAGGRNDPEAHVGVNKDLGDGVSANVGVGTSSGNLSVGVAKSVEVNENVRVSVGASYSDAGWTVGPSVQFHDGQGNGVGLAGVIPTVTVGGYTVAIAPQLLVPNLVVIGARALYNWVKAEK